jgi:hypothetical protein
MKKITFLMCAVLACLLNANAQEPQFVSKEPQNRNVLIEEFTGRLCGYCPYGQVAVNQILAENPGRVFTVNIHAPSSLSPTSYPNLNTNKGAEVYMAFNAGGGIPAVTVNRGETIHPVESSPTVNKLLAQTAECNIGGNVLINEEKRTATITVEVYYTSNSVSDKNYLTVMMSQDSILGSQAGAETFNPQQMIGDQYVHMHTVRDYITETWGDEITTTTAGSLITKTYTYQIPEYIGEPNGVEVDLNNLHFIAFVSEQKQGTKTAPVLNVTGLNSYKVSEDEIYPYFGKIDIKSNVSCSEIKPTSIEFINGGTKEITSMKYEVEVWGVTSQYTWEGSLPSYSSVIIEEDLTMYLGERNVKFRIVEANGKSYKHNKEIRFVSEPWFDVYFQGEEDEFKIDILQDKFGAQITWELINSNEEVIAQGGPYTTLASNGTKLQRTKVKVPNNECIKFIIRDEAGNGINCGYGEGFYKITDSKGNLVLEGDGKFTNEVYHNISTKSGYASVDEMANETLRLYPNPVKETLTIDGQNIQQVNVYNTMGQLVKSVNCNDNIVNINVNDLQNGMYIVNVIDANAEMSSRKVSVLN